MQTKTKQIQTQHLLLQFPEVKLATRDAHKLRGYFGNLFKTHSPLLHNHFADGANIYRYPLVQYKVINGTPTLVGLAEGAELLMQLFLEIKELNIDGYIIPVKHKQIQSEFVAINTDVHLHNYKFVNLWMALNQKNYAKYRTASQEERYLLLHSIITGNILSFYKGIGYNSELPVLVQLTSYEKSTKFKGKQMLAFSGRFTVNAQLPNYIGLGKSVSRGFGTIEKMKKNRIF